MYVWSSLRNVNLVSLPTACVPIDGDDEHVNTWTFAIGLLSAGWMLIAWKH